MLPALPRPGDTIYVGDHHWIVVSVAMNAAYHGMPKGMRIEATVIKKP